VRFRVRSLSRELGSKYSTRDIKRVSTLSNRGIFAVTVGSQSCSKRVFEIGRHNIEERKRVA
jgi:hypothetical protein